jgi:hypothetical protein
MARAVEVALFVLVMVAGIGAWELYKGAVRPAQALLPVGDHLKCYDIGSGGPVGLLVRLTDQFGVEDVTVKDNKLLCVPATKEVLGPAS